MFMRLFTNRALQSSSSSYKTRLDMELKHANRFMDRVKHFIVPFSNPDIIQSSLEQLNLAHFKTQDTHFEAFLQRATSQPIPMHALITHLRQSLLQNAPLRRLLAALEKDKCISDDEILSYKPTLDLQLNLLLLVEAFTITMANSKALLEDVYQHICQRRGITDAGNPYYNFLFGSPYQTSLFERLKLISIDPGILSIIFHRQTATSEESRKDCDDFINKHHLSSWNAKAIEPAKMHVSDSSTIGPLGINILEAVWAESTTAVKTSGEIENAVAGAGLIKIMEALDYQSQYEWVNHLLPMQTHLDHENNYSLIPGLFVDKEKKKTSQMKIDPEWRDLYNSWNLRFCLANLKSTLLPIKLLIPSVLTAHPAHFKELRVLSLFLIGNLYINENVSTNEYFKPAASFSQSEKILKRWGQINEDYSDSLLRKLSPTAVFHTSRELHHQLLGEYPTWNFMKHLYEFSSNPLHYRQFPSPLLPSQVLSAHNDSDFTDYSCRGDSSELGMFSRRFTKSADNSYSPLDLIVSYRN